MIDHQPLSPHAVPIIHLFKGVLYNDNINVWKSLIQYQNEIKKYFATIGIEVFIDEAEGFAFLKQKEYEEEQDNLPKLIERRQLSYPVTLLCVLLRKKLLEADAAGGEERTVLSLDQIKEMLKIFLPESTTNEAKIINRISEYVNKIEGFGFIRKMKGEENKYEIRRILTAYITADVLSEILTKLKEFHQTWEENLKTEKRHELEF